MLNERDMSIAEEVAKCEKTISEICETHGISRVAYYKKLKENKEFADFLQQLFELNKQEALSVFKANSVKAAKLIVAAIDGTTRISKPRLDAARDLLDRIGLNPAIKYQQAEKDDAPRPLDPNDIRELLKQRTGELKDQLKVVSGS